MGVVMRSVLIALAFATLAGCATHLVPLDQTTAVPSGYIQSTKYTTPAPDTQKITVARNAGTVYGAGGNLLLFVDGEQIAELATSESLALYLPEGQHLLSVGPKYARFMNHDVSAPVTVPSRFQIYRIDMDELGQKLQPSLE
jgi:type IV pilus biogenesis protein CpaD/CtpE